MEQKPPTSPSPDDQSSPIYPPPPSYYTNYAAPPTRPIDSIPPPYLAPLPNPVPFRRRRRSIWPIIAAIVGALLIVAIFSSVGLFLVRTNTTSNASALAATPTNTVVPTATPFPTYLDANPSCDNNGDWSAAAGSKVTCHATSVTLTQTATAQYISELDYEGAGTTSINFPSTYEVSVNISALNNGCGGLLVLGNNPQALGLYLCQDGSWHVFIYDKKGNSRLLQASPSGAVALATSNMMSVLVTPKSVQLTIDGSVQTTLQRTDTLGTEYVSLAAYAFDGVNAGSANFDSFSYHPLSVS